MKKSTILCPATLTLGLISSKWKAHILAFIGEQEEGIRFGELGRLVPGISKRVLTQSLNELVADDILVRTEYPEVPPRVVYTLTKLGQELQPVIRSLAVFGLKYMQDYRDQLCERFDKQELEEQIKYAIDKQLISSSSHS